MIKWRVDHSFTLAIQPREFDRETENYVYKGSRRYAKFGRYKSFHDSWADAREFQHRRILAKIANTERDLQDLMAERELILRLQEPS